VNLGRFGLVVKLNATLPKSRNGLPTLLVLNKLKLTRSSSRHPLRIEGLRHRNYGE